MYAAIKVLAFINLVLHVVLHYISVTDYFNRIFIAISVVILLLPRKWWGIYLLPVILMLAGLIVGGYLLYIGMII